MPNVRILIVDDEDFNRQTLRYCLEPEGFVIDEAGDGAEAWAVLTTGDVQYDAILLDRKMPEMDGMEVLAKIKGDPVLKDIPVIMQTAMDLEAEIVDGIEAGVYYYLTKPYDVDVLVSVVRGAADNFARLQRVQQELAKRSGAILLLAEGRFVFRTPKEADALAILLASGLDRSAAVAMGLSELMINAIEHGNLELDYKNKSALMAEGRWDAVIETRLRESPYKDRRVTVDVVRTSTHTRFKITDEGKGFDWRAYVDLTMKRAFDTHGRGIAMARKMAFEAMAYMGGGNIVEVMARGAAVSGPVGNGKPVPMIVLAGPVPGGIADRLRGVEGWSVAADGDAAVAAKAAVTVSASGAGAVSLRHGDAAGSPLRLPADPDIVEAVARALVLPATMEIGGEAETRLSPALSRHQNSLLPDAEALGKGAGLRLAAWSLACSGVSGDIWGGRVQADGRLALFIADMTGHGPVAGVNAFRLHALSVDSDGAPDAVLRRLDGILNKALPTGEYAAMLYGVLDVAARRFDYAAAGVPHPVAFSPGGGDPVPGLGKGLPVGASGAFPYELRRLDIPAGGSLVLFTDGLFTLMDGDTPSAHAFERLIRRLADVSRGGVAQGLAALIDGRSGLPADDVTALCLTFPD
ncbi:MAG: SpoIIE family protein phosphatase [Rhodospirillales bacterium]